MKKYLGVTLSALPIFLLQACGASNPNGVPLPVPAPPPAPTPTPTPPPPTDANASLFDLTQTENFDNDATSVAISQSGQTNTSDTDLEVVYDVDRNSYTIRANSQMQEFRPADRDANVNTAFVRGYSRTEGTTVDQLFLTKAGDRGNPLKTKYVGSGFWTRMQDAKLSSIDAFTYGAETEDAALTRTGSGFYDVQLAGYAGTATGLNNTLAGRGVLQIDFATGDIKVSGLSHELTPGTLFLPYNEVDRMSTDLLREDIPFLGFAKVSSNANLFSGTFFYDFLNLATGTLGGRFYGPNAEEVGGSFSARRDDGSFVTGTLSGGPDDDAIGENLNLTNLAFNQSFLTARTRSALTLRNDGSGMERSSLADGNLSHREVFDFNAADNSYELSPFSTAFGSINFGPQNQIDSESDSRFTVYRFEDAATAQSFELKLYNPGTGNDELALSYAGFGGYEILSSNTNFDIIRAGFFNYGIVTSDAAVPRTGSASYTGVLYGLGFGSAVGSTYYRLSGTSNLNYDFANSQFTSEISAVGTDQLNGGTRDFGSFSFSGAAISGNRSFFEGTADGGLTGNILGQLNGPDASEYSAIFNLMIDDSLMSGNQIVLHGAVAGKQD